MVQWAKLTFNNVLDKKTILEGEGKKRKMYYSSFGMLALVLTAIINYDVLRNRKKEKWGSAKVKYKYFLLSIMAYYITDVLWGIFYDAHLIGLVYADTVLYFLFMALSILFWIHYVVDFLGGKGCFTKILKYAGFIYLAFMAISLIVNMFVPVVFSFDSDMVYCTKFLRDVTLIIQIVFFFATHIYTLVNSTRMQGKERRHLRIIGLSSIIMTAFILVQTFFPLLPFYAIGLLIATCLVETFITHDEILEYSDKLGDANRKIYIDPLTGIKNVHAYFEDLEKFNNKINDHELKELAVAVFDLNGLKKVNDTKGHEAGDKYIQVASQFICRKFKHSPVYRIGGDEFVALLTGEDYENRASIIKSFEEEIEQNAREGLMLVVASGYSDFVEGKDNDCRAVFNRADRKMYERKDYLKHLPKQK